jgi:predicted lipoprotein with Yx(FWY)xxD motif
MKFYQRKAAIAIAVMAGLCATWSCKKDNNSNNTSPANPVANIQVRQDATFGSIMTDSLGRTLYFFSIDANGSSGCTGGCVTAWPVFYKDSPTLDTALSEKDFGSITRSDGAKQTTYKGWPLYYFQNDVKAGDVKGDGVGTVWFVAKPDYTVMLANIQLVGKDGVAYDHTLQPGQEVTQYITDAYGKTLYSFSPDKFKKNNFTKSDFSNNTIWPIDSNAVIKKIPSTLDKTQFDTLMVFGKVQLSYKGWPLYYFGSDAGVRGSTKGVSVPTPGVWPYVNGSTLTAPIQ